jgi:hypothetical protein
LEKPSSKKKKACEGLLRVSRMIVAVARTLAEDLFSKISPSSPGGAVHGERRPIFGHYLYPGNAVVVSVLCLGVGVGDHGQTRQDFARAGSLKCVNGSIGLFSSVGIYPNQEHLSYFPT